LFAYEIRQQQLEGTYYHVRTEWTTNFYDFLTPPNDSLTWIKIATQ